MLSWSSHEAGENPDLTAIAAGSTIAGVALGDVLLRFASACGQDDDEAIAIARRELVDVAGELVAVDAAAVACNFEMMTRLADSTGARMPSSAIERQAAVIGATGVADLASRR